MRALPFAFRKAPSGGGGSPSTVWSVAPGDSTGNASTYSTQTVAGRVTADQSGNVSTLFVFLTSQNYVGQGYKLGLYDSSRNLLAEGVGVTTTGTFGSITLSASITPTAVTVSTDYFVGVTYSADNFGNTGTGPGVGNFDDTTTYAASMAATLVSGPTGSGYCTGMEITP